MWRKPLRGGNYLYSDKKGSRKNIKPPLSKGIAAGCYHGGMDDEERDRQQDLF